MTSTAETVYAERLTVPLRWWVQGTMLVATLWLALVVAVPGPVAWVTTALALGLLAAALLTYGSARVELRGGELRAGPAHIEVAHLGAAVALDADQTRRAAGVDADARAFLVLRPYLKRAVKVTVTDPADPTPYWLVSTRHPERLVEALRAATSL
ncbi:DUF3093 domain-containing protein [Nocardioides sp. cx-169]|uniref:DUF3093 domain-containing protein n=1 Tax=Nocardioides sp. cx-169 TaxID=2899080 RepID=UPI001E56D9CE|nr:DUF3093 domain-containing protein [Nocardioides sp. cx-169]MCD4534886.1 DUF3093 domain-containing protein [Nocardioides sp. cx-169]